MHNGAAKAADGTTPAKCCRDRSDASPATDGGAATARRRRNNRHRRRCCPGDSRGTRGGGGAAAPEAAANGPSDPQQKQNVAGERERGEESPQVSTEGPTHDAVRAAGEKDCTPALATLRAGGGDGGRGDAAAEKSPRDGCAAPGFGPRRSGGEGQRRAGWWRRRGQHHHEREAPQETCDAESNAKKPPAVHRSALRTNVHVRCIGGDGLPYQRTLQELLLFRGAAQPEANTPCLGPAAAPSCVRLSLESDPAQIQGDEEDQEESVAGETEQDATLSRIEFTLDGVATPRTFAAFKRQEQGLDVSPTSASLVDCENSVCDSRLSPPHALRLRELPHQYLLRNYVNGSFLFYQAEDTKREFFTFCRDIASQALPIFEAEPLFSCLVAPTFVFGDIHGNFEDLSFFLRNVLTFHDLQLTPANVLCLGDYVDRGQHSLECLVLLLALKISYPSKLVMLRGNHEDRVVCGDVLTYGPTCFLAQCEALFGAEDGRQLFRELTSLFRHFPLAAELIIPVVPNNDNNNGQRKNSNRSSGEHVAAGSSQSMASQGRQKTHEERVLCAHGGIPRFFAPPKDDDSLAFLRHKDFPRMLTLFPHHPAVKNDPELQMDIAGQIINGNASTTCGISDAVLRKAWFVAFDLLWSDPSTDDSEDDDDDNGDRPRDGWDPAACGAAGGAHAALHRWGFGINKRGSNVLTFSSRAVGAFLSAHTYSMLFRAHQEKAHGLRLSKSSRVLTVFSSSNYLGHGNGAGCVLVSADGEIQLMEKTSD